MRTRITTSFPTIRTEGRCCQPTCYSALRRLMAIWAVCGHKTMACHPTIQDIAYLQATGTWQRTLVVYFGSRH